MVTTTMMATVTTTTTRTTMGAIITTTDAALYRLLAWLSPSYPVGAFTRSHGLEWAVEQGWVTTREGLADWLADLLLAGSARTDAVLFAFAWHAARAGDAAGLRDLAQLGAALAPMKERRAETMAQGAAFRRISMASWPAATLALLDDLRDDALPYPVAVAVLAAGHGVPLGPGLTGYLHAFAANLISAAQRLVPLGQTHAQQALADIADDVIATAAWAAGLDPASDPLDHVSGAAFRSDIAAMAHETQYTRLFTT
ncbi:urease accessory protein UreF [Zavarzinia sp. CC-PAN008]|uniref:urease accessory protein UreF n=1 Tax=Zavarzinia sp. CC-PAN008 TaxID=3243332 RepID=UPI003F744EAD